MSIPTQCNRNKTMIVDSTFIESLKEACNWKKAERLPEDSYYSLFIGDELLKQLEVFDHQIIWGRRGTGKTHLLKAFTQKINANPKAKALAFYISCDELSFQTPVDMSFNSDMEKMKYLAKETYKCFLLNLVEMIINEYESIVKNKDFYLYKTNGEKKEYRNRVDNSLMALYENCTYGLPIGINMERTEIESQSKLNSKESSKKISVAQGFSLKNLISNFKFFSKNSRDKKTIQTSSDEKKVTYNYGFNTSKTRLLIKSIIDALQIDCLYLCLDELWLIDKKREISLQPLFLEYLRQAFFNSKQIIIKIASIREVTKMNSKASPQNSYGLQSGHDITELINLDTQLVNEKEKRVHFEKILTARINYFSQKREDKKYDSHYVVEAVFKNEIHLSNLITFSHVIARNFLTILQRSLNTINYDLRHKFIHTYLSKNIVIKTYLDDKRSNLPFNENSLFSTINNYINNTKNYFFLLPIEQVRRLKSEIDNLVYVEIIHQIPSSLLTSSLMDSYKGFYVDSGKYLYTLSQVNLDKDYGFSYILPEEIKKKYKQFILDVDKIESEFVECPNCSQRISKKHPIFVKTKLCPICAFEIDK